MTAAQHAYDEALALHRNDPKSEDVITKLTEALDADPYFEPAYAAMKSVRFARGQLRELERFYRRRIHAASHLPEEPAREHLARGLWLELVWIYGEMKQPDSVAAAQRIVDGYSAR